MTIKKLVNITDATLVCGKLENEIYNASIFEKKIEQGDLFIGKDQESVNIAIKNGAKTIIYDNKNLLFKNQNLNLLQVDSIKEASFKLIKYIHKESIKNISLLNSHEITFLKMILKRQNETEFLPTKWENIFEILLNSQKRVFISSDENILKLINPKIKPLTKESNGYIVSDTLFRTTFKVDKYIYQYKQIAPFHIEHILKVVQFCKDYELEYNLDNITYTKHFMPIFIEEEPTVHTAGKNDKVIIISDNIEDIIEAKYYTTHGRTWIAKNIILTPPKTKLTGNENPIYYQNIENILSILNGRNFNYAFVYTSDANIIKLLKQEYIV